MVTEDDLAKLASCTDDDLDSLPVKEDDLYEYKCSLTPDTDLATKIGKAASAFWNSGGGYFLAGVSDDTGRPDGGITTKVGREDRVDWIKKSVTKVDPLARHAVKEIRKGQSSLSIEPNKAVYVIGFADSVVLPHMAPDDRYYIRINNRSVPATHFLVDALFAKRGSQSPIFRTILRINPTRPFRWELGLVNVSSVPAIDVEMTLEHPRPIDQQEKSSFKFPIRRAFVDRDNPVFFPYFMDQTKDKEQLMLLTNVLHIKYRDTKLKPYTDELEIPPIKELTFTNDRDTLGQIEQHMAKIATVLDLNLKSISGGIGKKGLF